ncbi:MAG: ERAP1-like C-terminal domain-containing protein [Candidatus Solibacter usitatus]|nr:ERAP1-like C-terminal domain-containing protein [Candidatus Solibacter usitatus]
MRRFAALAVIACPLLAAAAEPGVSRELARARAAQISSLRYRLEITLTPGAALMPGREQIRFRLAAAGPVTLDFRDGVIRSVVVNGSPATDASQHNGHLEIPARYLRKGENTVALEFESTIATAGRPLTRYIDRDDSSEYVYTLFVPMDASQAFPCFDQPDLKGRFTLHVTAPESWTVISNTAPGKSEPGRTVFAETLPISTYLVAFAAGPFRRVGGDLGLYVRQSKLQRAQEEAPEVLKITSDGMKFLADFFGRPFPFPKYDQVLLPGFAYGGMEHAGATFLREEAVLFRTVPTRSDKLGRASLLLHELTHQWFGDLVTMRWFDDLWLKEGFADYMAYRTLAALEPPEEIWKRFYQSHKPGAYAIDATKGTTPIYQEVRNLADAKSAYGAIVYAKAPGLLRQLSFMLGEDAFRDGLRLYLKQHAYGNAEWADLIGSLKLASGSKLGDWANAWIRRRGMPQVDTDWACDEQGRIERLALRQKDVLNEGGVWPIQTQILLGYGNAPPAILRARLEGAQTVVAEARGKPCPAYVFANAGDYGYGRFTLDAKSRQAVMDQLSSVADPFLRTLLWGALWDAVREAELAPADYIALALKLLPAESDEALTQSLLGRVTTAYERYLPDARRTAIAPALEALCVERMINASELGMRITWYRAFRNLASTADGRGRLKSLLAGQLVIPGLEIKALDRWLMLTQLIAESDPDAGALLAAESQRDSTDDGRKYAYVAAAARADAAVKRRYFDDYLHNPAIAEDWVAQSLGAFNALNQTALTLPYLRPALDALPQVKRERKIFFLLGWLNAFIGGQTSSEALQQVRDFLATAKLDPDVERKVLEVVDELERTVRIRAKWPS